MIESCFRLPSAAIRTVLLYAHPFLRVLWSVGAPLLIRCGRSYRLHHHQTCSIDRVCEAISQQITDFKKAAHKYQIYLQVRGPTKAVLSVRALFAACCLLLEFELIEAPCRRLSRPTKRELELERLGPLISLQI
jgi:hypothetical protein